MENINKSFYLKWRKSERKYMSLNQYDKTTYKNKAEALYY